MRNFAIAQKIVLPDSGLQSSSPPGSYTCWSIYHDCVASQVLYNSKGFFFNVSFS